MQKLSSQKKSVEKVWARSRVVHGEVEKCKIFVQLCAGGALGQFWRACRRRTNLAVGYAACGTSELNVASRDGLSRTKSVGNSKTVPRAGQIAF